MRIREYTEADLDKIQQFYRRGKQEFELPDPLDARVIVRRCLEDDERRPRLFGFGRVQLNAFLLVDGTWQTPEARLGAIEVLEYAMIEEAREKGFDQVTAQVAPRFGRRLKELGWIRSIGVTYHREF